MADYKARIAPFINTTFYITSIYGVERWRTFALWNRYSNTRGAEVIYIQW